MNSVKIIVLTLISVACIHLAAQAQAIPTTIATPLATLKQTAPTLHTLYQAYPSYHEPFAKYAKNQGFKRPIENLATIIHEIIHIDSAVHQGYYIDGIYYEPYLRADAWPKLTNEQVRPHIQDQERSVITKLYANNTPKNHLGNIIDEINAYTHVLPFICKNEPDSTEKQIKNLTGFLYLTEAYLRTLRTHMPTEYQRFTTSKQARGAYTLVIQRAWTAIKSCTPNDNPLNRKDLTQESTYFLMQPK